MEFISVKPITETEDEDCHYGKKRKNLKHNLEKAEKAKCLKWTNYDKRTQEKNVIKRAVKKAFLDMAKVFVKDESLINNIFSKYKKEISTTDINEAIPYDSAMRGFLAIFFMQRNDEQTKTMEVFFEQTLERLSLAEK